MSVAGALKEVLERSSELFPVQFEWSSVNLMGSFYRFRSEVRLKVKIRRLARSLEGNFSVGNQTIIFYFLIGKLFSSSLLFCNNFFFFNFGTSLHPYKLLRTLRAYLRKF